MSGVLELREVMLVMAGPVNTSHPTETDCHWHNKITTVILILDEAQFVHNVSCAFHHMGTSVCKKNLQRTTASSRLQGNWFICFSESWTFELPQWALTAGDLGLYQSDYTDFHKENCIFFLLWYPKTLQLLAEMQQTVTIFILSYFK